MTSVIRSIMSGNIPIFQTGSITDIADTIIDGGFAVCYCTGSCNGVPNNSGGYMLVLTYPFGNNLRKIIWFDASYNTIYSKSKISSTWGNWEKMSVNVT